MKKEDLTFTRAFALLALNAQESERMSESKSAALRAIHVAAALEEGMDAEKAASNANRMFRKTISDDERALVKELSEEGLLTVAESVRALEIRYGRETCYKAEPEALSLITGELEKAIEAGAYEPWQKAMLWLSREGGLLPYMFTPLTVGKIMSSKELKSFPLWQIMFGKKLELGGVKRRVELVPVGEREADTFVEKIFLPKEGEDGLVALLKEKGHSIERRTERSRALYKIDGIWYSTDCDAVRIGRLRVEGIALKATREEI